MLRGLKEPFRGRGFHCIFLFNIQRRFMPPIKTAYK